MKAINHWRPAKSAAGCTVGPSTRGSDSPTRLCVYSEHLGPLAVRKLAWCLTHSRCSYLYLVSLERDFVAQGLLRTVPAKVLALQPF